MLPDVQRIELLGKNTESFDIGIYFYNVPHKLEQERCDRPNGHKQIVFFSHSRTQLYSGVVNRPISVYNSIILGFDAKFSSRSFFNKPIIPIEEYFEIEM